MPISHCPCCRRSIGPLPSCLGSRISGPRCRASTEDRSRWQRPELRAQEQEVREAREGSAPRNRHPVLLKLEPGEGRREDHQGESVSLARRWSARYLRRAALQ